MGKFTEATDAELIYACREGVAVAWDELVERYERLVFTIPRRYGLTPPEVEDVTQSVWLLLLQHLHTLKQPERVSAWLVTTARRESWNRRRGAAYERVDTVEPDAPPLTQQRNSETPEALVLRYEQQLALRRALEHLNERCQRLLYLLYYDPRKPSYADVAEDLGVAVGTVGPQRIRCLKQLRKLLGDN